MMELLCMKDSCGKYVRITDDVCELTSLSKATVFPATQTVQVVELLERLRSSGCDMHCVKLTITEERCDL